MFVRWNYRFNLHWALLNASDAICFLCDLSRHFSVTVGKRTSSIRCKCSCFLIYLCCWFRYFDWYLNADRHSLVSFNEFNVDSLNMKKKQRKWLVLFHKEDEIFHLWMLRRFLICVRVNITLGTLEERMTITGLYTIRDAFCCCCGLLVGWKYAISLSSNASSSFDCEAIRKKIYLYMFIWFCLCLVKPSLCGAAAAVVVAVAHSCHKGIVFPFSLG